MDRITYVKYKGKLGALISNRRLLLKVIVVDLDKSDLVQGTFYAYDERISGHTDPYTDPIPVSLTVMIERYFQFLAYNGLLYTIDNSGQFHVRAIGDVVELNTPPLQLQDGVQEEWKRVQHWIPYPYLSELVSDLVNQK